MVNDGAIGSGGLSEASPKLSTTTSDPPQKKGFSCILCAQRKVKCDRVPGGCRNCIQARVACIYKAPPPPRRRKKGSRDVDTTTRLRLYEDALRHLGVDPEELIRHESSKEVGRQEGPGINDFLKNHIPAKALESAPSPEVGILVSEEGKSRYLENSMWTDLQGEFRESKEFFDGSSEDGSPEDMTGFSPEPAITDGANLILGGLTPSVDFRSLHPQPDQTLKLWQLYLDNINPLVKTFHAPTVEQLVLDASCTLDDIPRNVETLMFAIYCITTESLSDGECIAMLGQPKAVASQRFRLGAQQALIKASFLTTSDTMVLQAFTLFILSLQYHHARLIWMLSGIAQRIGQRIGLHRDGELLKLPPYETEMRRRLWWQIVMLEGYAQNLAGTGSSGTIIQSDVKMPSNVNDSDLFPGMKEMPKEHEGATDMMFFLIRCLVGQFLKRSTDGQTTFDDAWTKLTTSTSTMDLAAKDKAIDELHAHIHRKFLQYCDPSIPWHMMCIHLGYVTIFMMRFVFHSTAHSSVDMAQQEQDPLFDLALQVLTSQNQAYTMREMQAFMWDVNMHFQWKAFIYILTKLRYRTEGAQVERAWKEIEKTYDFHPGFEKELSQRALPVAVNNLALKAWDAYIFARGVPVGGEPNFIQLIRAKKARTKSPGSRGEHANDVETLPLPSAVLHDGQNIIGDDFPAQAAPAQPFEWNMADFNASLGISNISDMVPLENPEQMNWSTWDSLLDDFWTHDTDHSTDFSAFDLGAI